MSEASTTPTYEWVTDNPYEAYFEECVQEALLTKYNRSLEDVMANDSWDDINYDSLFENCYFNLADPEGVWLTKPLPEIIWKTILMVLIVILSVVGNSLVIFVLVRHSQTRSSVNMFIGSMALADLLSTIFVGWAGLATNITQAFPLGPIYCKMESFFKYSFLLASAFSLIVMSGDRLKKVVWPFKKGLTTRQSLRVILVIWIVALSAASPVVPIRKYRERVWADMREVWCAEDDNDEGSTAVGIGQYRYYYIVLLLLLFYLPVLLMLIFYSVILLRMKKFQSRLNESGNPVKGQYRRKIIIMIWVYLVASTISWAPFQLLVLYRHYFKNKSQALPKWFREVVFFQHVLASLNAAINPIIYGIVNETFRRALTLHFPILGRVFACFSRRDPNNVRTNRLTENRKRGQTSGGKTSSLKAAFEMRIRPPSVLEYDRL